MKKTELGTLLILTTLFLISIVCLSFAESTPEGAPIYFEKIHDDARTPPPDRPYVQGWFQSATIVEGQANNGYIEIDYAKLIEIDLGDNETVILTENYNDAGERSLTEHEGGLYTRWFIEGSIPSVIPPNGNKISGGVLTINIGEYPNNIVHWWTIREPNKNNHKYALEVRAKIVGNIGFQIGVDYWKNSETIKPEDNTESWLSNWFGDTNGEYIAIRSPDFNRNIRFDSVDYGITQKGEYYLSKRLADYVHAEYVKICGDGTDWKLQDMALQGDNYVYSTNKSNPKSPNEYYFEVRNNKHLPYEIYEIENLLSNENDVKRNNQDTGWNFYTAPVDILPTSIFVEEKIEYFTLQQNIPNPFNSSTTIRFSLSQPDIVSIDIYNISGQKVDSLMNRPITSGNHLAIWDASRFSAGIYFCTIKAGIFTKTIPMTFIK